MATPLYGVAGGASLGEVTVKCMAQFVQGQMHAHRQKLIFSIKYNIYHQNMCGAHCFIISLLKVKLPDTTGLVCVWSLRRLKRAHYRC